MPATERESARIPEDIDVLEEASWYIPQHEVAHVAMPGQKFVSGTRCQCPAGTVGLRAVGTEPGAESERGRSARRSLQSVYQVGQNRAGDYP